ncbi:MAG: cytidylate kinase-like family protein [Desulfuromonadales bacterium]|nr:cytidylate kinase-like family protein [Desulfuromonadales bacterium]MBN2791415.1 cytidylate kinase-like family protein [Desulfuromonadales bacterium]
MVLKNFWTPQLEAKLQAWHRLQQVADGAKPAPCFTIAREFGCQAYPLAENLVKRLNTRVAGDPWVIIGREILDRVAELSGYSVAQIEKSQDTPSSLKAIFAMFLDTSHAEETEVFTHMRTVIREFARRGNCVLIGRGAVFATQDLPNCIHLRLVAPQRFRVEKIMKVHSLTAREAEKYIELHQQQRDDFVRRFAEGRIDDPKIYHLVINNSRMSVENIAELAEEYMIRYLD